MESVAIKGIPRLHEVSLETVRTDGCAIILEADDENEQRVQFVMSPYQAFRLTTTDCFLFPVDLNCEPQTVCEILDSDWITSLKANLKIIDHTATFLENAHHYFFPLGDNYLEVVAWELKMIPHQEL